MRWFKHLSGSHHDEKLSQLMDIFGTEGYGAWWIILEKIAALMDGSERTFATYSLKVWAKFCRISPKKFETLAKFLENLKLIEKTNHENLVTLNCPNLLKYRDEYTERRERIAQKKNNKIGTVSGQCPLQDRDRDTEEDNTILTNPDGLVVFNKLKTCICPHADIIKIYHSVLPMCPPVKTWHKNRAAYLKQRWAENTERQTLAWWQTFFEKVSESDFLTGRTEGTPGKPTFVADLEWLIRPTNFAKVLEEKYHRPVNDVKNISQSASRELTPMERAEIWLSKQPNPEEEQ